MTLPADTPWLVLAYGVDSLVYTEFSQLIVSGVQTLALVLAVVLLLTPASRRHLQS